MSNCRTADVAVVHVAVSSSDAYTNPPPSFPNLRGEPSSVREDAPGQRRRGPRGDHARRRYRMATHKRCCYYYFFTNELSLKLAFSEEGKTKFYSKSTISGHFWSFLCVRLKNRCFSFLFSAALLCFFASFCSIFLGALCAFFNIKIEERKEKRLD